MSGIVIRFPTEEENAAALQVFFTRQKALRAEHRAAAAAALPALRRLVEAMLVKTGQGYKLRGLLYSLWNGQPAPLNDTLCLGWELKRDVCAVVLGFGFDGSASQGAPEFFYEAIKSEVKGAGLWTWFLQAGEEGGAL